jgi:hypothetical protein
VGRGPEAAKAEELTAGVGAPDGEEVGLLEAPEPAGEAPEVPEGVGVAEALTTATAYEVGNISLAGPDIVVCLLNAVRSPPQLTEPATSDAFATSPFQVAVASMLILKEGSE